jgi:hypothetical protein
MKFLVGGFSVALGLFALIFTEKLVQASERTRTDFFSGSGKGGKSAGWRGFSSIVTRLVGIGMVLVGVLVLFNVLKVR